MDKYLSKLAKSLTPYVPGEQPKDKTLIKLNTNENPFPPSPKALSAMKKAVNSDLRLYPLAECESLREAVAKVENLPGTDYVYMGNGSDEVLAFCFAAFFGGEKPLLFPDVTYSFYPVYSNLYDINYKTIPLDENFNIILDDYVQDNCGVIFPNPNAPTGILTGMDEIISFLNKNTETVVIIDEAYIDFGGQSAVPLISKYPNLVIIKTLSKSHSFAGLRGGYVMAQPHLIDGIIRVKNSFNSYTMDTLSQVGMTAAILDTSYTRSQCEKVAFIRRETADALKRLGFVVLDSKANFLFVSHDKIPAEKIAEFLRKRRIIVRHFKNPERIENYLRISVGIKEHMEKLIEALKDIRELYR